MTGKDTNLGDALRPFMTVLDGTPVPLAELVAGGRRVAEVLVAHGRPVILCADDHWTGVWDLERLTDEEAASWGLFVAMKLGLFPGRSGSTTGVV